MAGHSQFKNIMHRKGAQDAKRSKVFTKLIREITVAARSGMPDPEMNPRLRAAVQAARAANMPKENVARAVKRAAQAGEGDNYEEIRYEGYGPGGVCLIVEALTDNRNRTASEVRAAFTKYNGSMGETGSVSFMFERVWLIVYGPGAASPDDMFEAALEAGAGDVESTDAGHEVTCDPDNFPSVRDGLEARFGEAEDARLDWKPQNSVAVDEKAAESLLKFLGVLEDNDDVQRVAANFDVDDEVLEHLSA